MRQKFKYLIKQIYKNPQDLYLVLALSFGFLFVFLIPPTLGYDENHHFYRAYQLSRFDLFARQFDNGIVGYEVPKSMYDGIYNFRTKNAKIGNDTPDNSVNINVQSFDELFKEPSSAKVPAEFRGAAVYAPTSYIGAIGGIYLSDMLHLSTYWYIIFAR